MNKNKLYNLDEHNFESNIELTKEYYKKEKIDLNIIPPYFFMMNTFALFAFLWYNL